MPEDNIFILGYELGASDASRFIDHEIYLAYKYGYAECFAAAMRSIKENSKNFPESST